MTLTLEIITVLTILAVAILLFVTAAGALLATIAIVLSQLWQPLN